MANAVLRPCPPLTAATVTDFHAAALAALRGGGDVEVELDGADELGGAHLQVLVALHEALARQGRALVLRGPSPFLTPLLEWGGLPALGD